MRKFWHIKKIRSYIKEIFFSIFFYFLVLAWKSTLGKRLPFKTGSCKSLPLTTPTNNGQAPSTPAAGLAQLV